MFICKSKTHNHQNTYPFRSCCVLCASAIVLFCYIDSSSERGSVCETNNMIMCKNRYIFHNIAHQAHLCHYHSPFCFSNAFTAISGQSKSVVEVWVAGAAVILTAAAVPSREFVEFERDRCDAPPVMVTSTMAAPSVETQSMMGGGDGERMRVV